MANKHFEIRVFEAVRSEFEACNKQLSKKIQNLHRHLRGKRYSRNLLLTPCYSSLVKNISHAELMNKGAV